MRRRGGLWVNGKNSRSGGGISGTEIPGLDERVKIQDQGGKTPEEEEERIRETKTC